MPRRRSTRPKFGEARGWYEKNPHTGMGGPKANPTKPDWVGDYVAPVPSYVQATTGRTTPTPAEAIRATVRSATSGSALTDLASGYLLRSLNDLLTPGPPVGDVAEAAFRLGVTPVADAGKVTIDDHADRRLAVADRAEKEVTRQRTNPKDPLGRKTLGAVSASELAQASRKGTMRITPKGVITTPGPRRALRDLLQTQHRVDRGTGITTGLGPSADAFADALSDYGDYDPQGIGAWVKSEGGAYEAGGEAGPQNWLGIGYPGHQTPFATSPYFSGSPRRAGRAAGEWIEGKIGGDWDYQAAPTLQSAIQSAKGGSAEDLLQGLAASGWGTNVAHVQQNLAGVQVRQDPQAVHALQIAKRQARAEGINPTRFNGDVAGGGPDFTWVRADAKGMVDWVESAVGVQEGDPKTMRWGARFGLDPTSPTGPWCANFVSNGLLRRGITDLPSNPNYVPSYEAEWAQYAVPGGLAKAKPGDLLTFSGRHIGVYVGNGEMISGNSDDEVSRTGVDSDLSMVIRPPYKGGKVKVADAQIAGSSMAAALGGVGGGGFAAPSGLAGAAAPQTERAAVQAGQVPISELLRPLALEPQVGGEEDETEGLGELARILKRGAL